MASTYTPNNGIELIGDGEQSGTWGQTTNDNLTFIDTALDGQVTVTLTTAGTSGSPNSLAITNGATSDGRNRFIEFDDGSDLGATAYVQLTPNDAEKIFVIKNSLSGGRSLILFQGTYNASTDFEVLNGDTVMVRFDGAGSGAQVFRLFTDIGPAENVDIDGGSIDGATIGANSAAAGTFTDLTATGTSTLTTVDINGGSIDGTTIGGTTRDDGNFNNITVTVSADIDGGSIDGTTIGSSTASTGAFTTLDASGDVAFDTSGFFFDQSLGRVGIGTASPSAALDVSGQLFLSASTTQDRRIEIGAGRSGNGNSLIDFIGDATYTDYGLRIIRSNSGANATSAIQHRGTGDLSLIADEAADIVFQTDSSERMRLNDAQASLDLKDNIRLYPDGGTAGTNGALFNTPSSGPTALSITQYDANDDITIGTASAGVGGVNLRGGGSTVIATNSSAVDLLAETTLSSGNNLVLDDGTVSATRSTTSAYAVSVRKSTGLGSTDGDESLGASFDFELSNNDLNYFIHAYRSGTKGATAWHDTRLRQEVNIDNSGSVQLWHDIGFNSSGVKEFRWGEGTDDTTVWMVLHEDGSNGYLGLNLSGDPAQALHIGSSGNARLGDKSSITMTGGTDENGVFINSGGVVACESTASSGRFRRNDSDGDVQQFYRDNSNVGSISVTTTATSYNTSSDERKKENIRAVQKGVAGSVLDSLQVREFNWKASGKKQDFGVVAQEVSQVYPDATTYNADADDWMIDYSKLVPLLLAEVKELRERVSTLEGA